MPGRGHVRTGGGHNANRRRPHTNRRGAHANWRRPHTNRRGGTREPAAATHEPAGGTREPAGATRDQTGGTHERVQCTTPEGYTGRACARNGGGARTPTLSPRGPGTPLRRNGPRQPQKRCGVNMRGGTEWDVLLGVIPSDLDKKFDSLSNNCENSLFENKTAPLLAGGVPMPTPTTASQKDYNNNSACARERSIERGKEKGWRAVRASLLSSVRLAQSRASTASLTTLHPTSTPTSVISTFSPSSPSLPLNAYSPCPPTPHRALLSLIPPFYLPTTPTGAYLDPELVKSSAAHCSQESPPSVTCETSLWSLNGTSSASKVADWWRGSWQKMTGEETVFQTIDGEERGEVHRRRRQDVRVQVQVQEVGWWRGDSDLDFEQESEDGSPSSTGSSFGPGAEGSAETEGDDSDDEAIVELDPKKHPLLRAVAAGAVPKMSRPLSDSFLTTFFDGGLGVQSPSAPPVHDEHRHRHEESKEEDELED
ncbi:hypothetical protein EDB83DRAFT_2655712 [Lactarius deliciosus]|nr:hypothetical protein EDB83DRAFT_2655712 [Lactarius deliciosus]